MNKCMFGGLVCVLLLVVGVFGGCYEPQSAPSAFGCGCPEQPTPLPQSPPTEVSGARLVPYQAIANDGTVARSPGKYHDKQLGVLCSFIAPTDEQPTQYCLPEVAPWFYGGYFNDVACTIPITFIGQCDTIPKYVKQAKENGCYAKITAFYEVIGTPTSSDIYWLSPNGECTKQTNPTTNSVVVLVSDVVPWETFVAASVEPMSSSD